jgi:Holliday junction resolvase RusA-like endonuclease
MIIVEIKPLSVNVVFQGRRFKTPEYKKYERDCLLLLPQMDMPKPPYHLHIMFGLSSKLADIDNPVKPFLDILQKKYGINDRDIVALDLRKRLVDVGKEYISWQIKTF